MFIGIGTVVNVLAVLVGSSIGVLAGHRMPQRTRDVVTDALGLVTLLIAAASAVAVFDPVFRAAVGSSAPMLIVLGALLIGGIVGSLLRVEDRIEGVAGRIQTFAVRRFGHNGAGLESRERFITGFMTASLIYCVGPLTILGSLTEGIGNGPDQLLLKSALDGFASIAFAASFGWGVAASVLAVGVIQGSLTLLGAVLGAFLPDAQLAAITATGGLLLVAIAIRFLHLKPIRVGDMLPALVVAPLLVALVAPLV